jgi:butyryl-CoA dehydrogenase
MDYFLTDEQAEIKKLAEKITKERVMPVRAALDENEEFPWEIIKILADAGLFGVFLPEDCGGLGGAMTELVVATEELSRGCVGVSTSYAASALGSFPILLNGSDAQKKKYLPDIASGEKLAAFALTEADAGSDAGGIKTTAQKDGDSYILNGTKQWITNGGEAEIYTIIALTDRSRGPRGASAFIVEKDTPGFSFGKKEKKMGIRASSTRELVFEDCRVPAENLIGKEGIGFMVTMKTLDKARVGVGAQAVGLAQEALDLAVRYSRERHQFGRPVSSFQSVQHILADMAVGLEASRALVYATARYIDSEPRSFVRDAAMAKVFATDMAMKISVDAVQIFGGYGYMRDYPVEKLMRDAKILQIYEGTNQIQRNVIGQNLIKEGARKGK